METTLDRNLNLNVSLQANLPEVPEEKTAAQAVLAPLLARLGNLTVSQAPLDLEALMARLGNDNSAAKEQSAKQFLGSLYGRVLARLQESSQITAKNMELLTEASKLGAQREGVAKQLNDQVAALEALKKQLAGQTATVTELELKTAMLEKQVELAKSQQLTPAEKRVAELKKKRQQATDKAQQEHLDRQIAEAEQELLAAQASVVQAQGALATAQGALATACGNLVAMQSQVSAASKQVTDLSASQTNLEKQIKECTDQLSDEEVARALAEALKATAGEARFSEDALPERSEDQEKYLEENSVLRILQGTAEKRAQEMQDTIEAKREEKV
ncbi:MAG: hypothetical protein II943_11840 [Victivallales bacterium]|nr:hypothetical protein [Victivallales bacterium]